LESAEKKEAPKFESDDISQTNKDYVRDFVSVRTLNAGNSPAISPNTTETKYRNSDGSPADLKDYDVEGQPTNLENMSEDSVNELKKYSNFTLFFDI
jgi:hypothetical protein